MKTDGKFCRLGRYFKEKGEKSSKTIPRQQNIVKSYGFVNIGIYMVYCNEYFHRLYLIFECYNKYGNRK